MFPLIFDLQSVGGFHPNTDVIRCFRYNDWVHRLSRLSKPISIVADVKLTF